MKNKQWGDYYKDHYKIHKSNILLHWQYLFNIVKLRPKNILEIGCGPADHSFFLSYILPKTRISLLDNDKKIILNLTKKNKKEIEKIYYCDVISGKMIKQQKFSNNQFNLIFSQGLLEHFSKEDLRKIIINFLPYTKEFIFSVPSENYPNLDYGNEILRNKKEIESIFKPIKNIDAKVYKYFPDIGIRTKFERIKKNKMSIIDSINFFIFGGCHYVIKIKKHDKK